MKTLILILFLALIFRPIRIALFRNARMIVPGIVLFFMGYWAGESLARIAGPPWLCWLGGLVFVIEGLPQVLSYLDGLNRNRRQP